MHVLIILAGLLAGAAFWWYRLKMLRDAGSEVADVIGRAQGNYRCSKIKKANAESPIAAIDDPVTACSALLYSMLANPETVQAQDSFMHEQLRQFADSEKALEAAVYGRWAALQRVDERKSTKMLCEKLDGWLSANEKADIVSIIEKMQTSDLFALSETRTANVLARLQQHSP